MKEIKDRALINILKSGDEKRIEQGLLFIIRKYRKKVVSVIENRGLPQEEIEEVFNDGLLVLMKNAIKGLLDKDDSRIEPYLIGICKNISYQKYQKKQKLLALTASENTIPLDTNYLDVMLNKERQEIIDQLLHNMKEDCRSVIMGFYFYKKKMAEIAKEMNYKNEQTARNKKAKCMKALKTFVQQSNFFKAYLKK